MEITDARVRLINDGTDRLKAFCSITFDDEFVIRDLKIVDGVTGLFVAMPSRKNTVSCPDCRHKNVVRSRYCNDCGAQLPHEQMPTNDGGRNKSHRDIAHPITTEFREYVQKTVIAAFRKECKLAASPDYEPQEIDDEPIVEEEEELVEVPTVRGQREPREQRPPRGERVERRQENVDYVNDYGALIANLKGGAPKEAPRPMAEARRPAPPRPNQQENRPPQRPRPPQRNEQRGEQRGEQRSENRGRTGGPPREGNREQPRRDNRENRDLRDNREARPVVEQPQQRPPRTGVPRGERPTQRPAQPPSLEERAAMGTPIPRPAMDDDFGASIPPVRQEAPPVRAPEPVRAPQPIVRAPEPAPVVEPAGDSEDSPFGVGV